MLAIAVGKGARQRPKRVNWALQGKEVRVVLNTGWRRGATECGRPTPGLDTTRNRIHGWLRSRHEPLGNGGAALQEGTHTGLTPHELGSGSQEEGKEVWRARVTGR